VQVLIVDDDPKFGTHLGEGLEAHGIGSRVTTSAAEALAAVHAPGSEPPDLILLDVMMPERSGWEFLEELRANGHDTPVIFVTARRAVQDRVRGLHAGADDYILKPFEFDELLARIQAVLRRRAALPVIALRDVRVDLRRRVVERSGRRVELSPREFDVLRVLVENRGRVVSREELLRNVWGIEFDPQTNVVDTVVARLRRRVDHSGEPLIQTVVGSGYRIRSMRGAT
jgi:two-component system copper resistance phosphate regulon response regulator CusR